MPSNLYRSDSNAASREVKKVRERGAVDRENIRQQAATRNLIDDLELSRKTPELLGKIDALERQVARPITITAKVPEPKPAPDKSHIDVQKCLAASVTALIKKRVKQIPYDQTISEYFPEGTPAYKRSRAASKALLLGKSATDHATTTGAGWGAELVQSDVLPMIQPLEYASVFGQMLPGARTLPFGNNNSLTFPKRSGTRGAMSGSFTGEGASIPVKQRPIGSVSFLRYKAGVISVFSDELATVSTPAVASVIEDMIRDDTILMFDNYIMDVTNGPIPTIAPASPWYNAPTQASSGTTLANIVTDLTWLLNHVLSVRPRKPVLIMDPARVMRLRLLIDSGQYVFRREIEENNSILGVPLIVSPNVPDDQVYTIDLDDFVVTADPPEIDVSSAATVVMVDDDGVAPTMADTNAINDTGGSIHISDAAGTTPASAVKSTFQMNASAIRMVHPISFGMLRDDTPAYLTAVAW